MNYMITKYIKSIVLIVILVFASCKNKEHQYHNLNEKIEAKSANYSGTNISSEVYNETIKKIKISEGNKEFYISERKSQITSYSCSECHNQPIKLLKDTQVGKKAHWDIVLNHANKETMNCNTCHAKDNMNELRSITNKAIDLNLSHKLCSQCHQKEGKDWVGGAHGKQIGGWAPPRLSQTCTGCHNPHSPSFEKRWPAQFNTQKVKERQ